MHPQPGTLHKMQRLHCAVMPDSAQEINFVNRENWKSQVRANGEPLRQPRAHHATQQAFRRAHSLALRCAGRLAYPPRTALVVSARASDLLFLSILFSAVSD